MSKREYTKDELRHMAGELEMPDHETVDYTIEEIDKFAWGIMKSVVGSVAMIGAFMLFAWYLFYELGFFDYIENLVLSYLPQKV